MRFLGQELRHSTKAAAIALEIVNGQAAACWSENDVSGAAAEDIIQRHADESLALAAYRPK
jgi:hypothetical protein